MTKIFDGHNDTLEHIYRPDQGKGRSFLKKSKIGHIDLPRAKKGNLCGGIFAIRTPPPKSSPERDFMYRMTITKEGYRKKLDSSINHGYAKKFTDSVIDLLYSIEKDSKGSVKVVTSHRELKQNFKKKTFSIVLHFEGAAAIDKSLDNLAEYYAKGLRSLGITWSRPNAFGTGIPYKFPHSPNTGAGLTVAGKALVRECNKMGIIVDLAHLNEKGFWDVEKIATKPLVVSHAGAYSICAATRNITDKQIDAVGRSSGIVGVLFEPGLLREDGKPETDMSLDLIVHHVDYIINRIGVDQVGFGSDFDGAMMPNDMQDVSELPVLIKHFKKRGYDNSTLEKICYKNWFRVMKEIWD